MKKQVSVFYKQKMTQSVAHYVRLILLIPKHYSKKTDIVLGQQKYYLIQKIGLMKKILMDMMRKEYYTILTEKMVGSTKQQWCQRFLSKQYSKKCMIILAILVLERPANHILHTISLHRNTLPIEIEIKDNHTEIVIITHTIEAITTIIEIIQELMR